MSEGPAIQIELTPKTRAFLSRFAKLPQELLEGIRAGMDEAAVQTVSNIQANRLSGKGPFPVAEGRLGVRTNLLRSSLRSIAAVVVSDGTVARVEGAIGANVRYARLHEEGADFTRTTKAGKVRLRTDKNGQLITRGNLATFARKSHKRFREVAYEGGKTYKVHIPARAPIGHGVADNAATFSRSIARKLREVKEAQNL